MTAREANTLSVALTLAQCQLILQALSERPFKTVFALIGQLNQQAHRLFFNGVDAELAQTFLISAADLALSVDALGEMPFKRVNALLAHVNREILAHRNGHHVENLDHGGI